MLGDCFSSEVAAAELLIPLSRIRGVGGTIWVDKSPKKPVLWSGGKPPDNLTIRYISELGRYEEAIFGVPHSREWIQLIKDQTTYITGAK